MIINPTAVRLLILLFIELIASSLSAVILFFGKCLFFPLYGIIFALTFVL